MRIKLTGEAEKAMGLIVDQILKQNPFIERDNSRLISAIVVTLQRYLQPRYRDELIQAISTPESARLSLMREVEILSQGMDADAIRGLESTVRKLRAQGASGVGVKKSADKTEENVSG
ncbi:hypothetical protein WDW37_08970 [Bdellovibrionota bacterium FG-1]